MKVGELFPVTVGSEPFRKDRGRFFPDKPGCYVLTTFQGDVLYIGLASKLRRRVLQHLDNAQKTSLTPKGRAVLVHWIEVDDFQVVERTWLNIHLQSEGVLPVLNRIYSPVSA